MPRTLINTHTAWKEGLNLLTAGTPNGWKATIFLELLGLDYYMKPIDFMKANENKEDWFVNYNPNSKIPTLLVVGKDGKVTKSIPESAAILIYLADTYDKENKFHYPLGHDLHYEELSWIFFQMASLGPQQGQANHFNSFCKEHVPYGIKRYTDEANRLYDVLDGQLKKTGTGFVVGDHLSLADILIWPWVHARSYAKVSIEERPHIKSWYETLGKLEAFQRGIE